MYKYRSIRFTAVSALAVLAFSLLVSCHGSSDASPDASPTPVLFGPTDDLSSLLGGNLLYGSFLTSDGKSVFYQSKDGTCIVSSLFDGSGAATLTARVTSCIEYEGGQLFFIAGTGAGPIYKIDIDGQGETIVTDDPASSFLVLKSCLYYISAGDGQVYRILHDGSEKTLIFPGTAASILHSRETLAVLPASPEMKLYTITDDQLSFSSPDNPLQLEDFTSISTPVYPYSLNFSGDTLYYTDELFSRIYSAGTDGHSRLLFKREIGQPFIVSGGYLYYIDSKDSGRLYRTALESPSVTHLVVNDSVNDFVVVGNSIYYKRISGFDIFRTQVDGGQSRKIT